MSHPLTLRLLARRLFPVWRPSAGPTLGGLALLGGAGVLELLQPWPVKWLVDGVLLRDRPLPDYLVAWIPALAPDRLAGSLLPGILTVCVATLVLALAFRLSHLLSQHLLIVAGLSMVQRLRCRVCDALARNSLRFHDGSKLGDLLARAAYDSYAAQSLLSGAVAPAATGIVLLLGVLVIMLRLDPLLTVVSLAVVPLFWLTAAGYGRQIERRSRHYHEHQGTLYAMLLESFSAMRVVQTYTMEDRLAGAVARETSQSFRLNARMTFSQLMFNFAIGVVLAAGMAAVIYVGASRVAAGRISVGDLLVFLAYLAILYNPINSFAQCASTLQGARTQLARVFELLDMEPEIASLPNARKLSAVRGELSFEDVTFGYDPERPVLTDVSVSAGAGEVIAIVGRTGSGKSSLAGLLPRLYDPQRGRICLDGVDLRELDLTWLRQQMAVVLQEPVLFSGTIRENIEHGRPGASFEQIREAAQNARAAEFIDQLPDGYETILGERGVNLSGGQRQRLAIARAFLRDAPVLILDEPTSALDGRTEAMLLESLETLMLGRTTLVIAHRLSTIRRADRIWVVDQGRIVQEGTHTDLLQRPGMYRSLCETQFDVDREISLAEWPPAA